MKNIKLPNGEEYEKLINISENDRRKMVRQRAKIILLRLKGLVYRKIAKLTGCNKDTVCFWVNYWNKNGIGGIVTWRTTNTWKRQFKRRLAIEKILSVNPKSWGIPFTTWSLRTLKVFLKDWFQYFIIKTTLQNDLKILNIRYMKTKDKFIFKPPNYDIRRAQLRYIVHFCPPRSRIIFLDEKGPVHALRYLGRSWNSILPLRDIRQMSNGKIMFLGGYSFDKDKIEMIPMETSNSRGFCQALDWIKLEFLKPPYLHLILVMDNARIHLSRYTWDYVQNDPQIDFFFLPPYSPELNPIENIFNLYQRELLNNGTFTSTDELIQDIKSYVKYYNTLRKEIFC